MTPASSKNSINRSGENTCGGPPNSSIKKEATSWPEKSVSAPQTPRIGMDAFIKLENGEATPEPPIIKLENVEPTPDPPSMKRKITTVTEDQDEVKRKSTGVKDPVSDVNWDKGCQLCRKNDGLFMLQCTVCEEWFHGSCVGVTKKMEEGIAHYHCRACAVTRGPSEKKPRGNWHRQDPYEENGNSKKTESGSPKFMEELFSKKFLPIENILRTMKGRDLNTEFLREDGFEFPIVVHDRAGLDLVVPADSFDYERVVSALGPGRTVIAIDVPSQEDGVELRLDQYLAYMRTAVPRDTILNIISLEFTNTPLAIIVEPPMVVRELSWADNLFTNDEAEYAESGYTKPEVQKYCLMSAQGSYTDFHIDFAGTSVWYHIFKGAKVFYLIHPSDKNLELYEKWMQSDDQAERFLGDETECYKLELSEGETVLLPSGWIHAVYTPVDSLVFGGNFLHHLASTMQIKINSMETRLATPERYRYPHFYTSCWLALRDSYEVLDELMRSKKPVQKWALKSCLALYTELKEWISKSEGIEKAERIHQIPATIRPNDLTRKVSKLLCSLPDYKK